MAKSHRPVGMDKLSSSGCITKIVVSSFTFAVEMQNLVVVILKIFLILITSDHTDLPNGIHC